MANTFLNNVDEEKVSALLTETEENSKYFTDIYDKVVHENIYPLDELMQTIYSDIQTGEDCPTDALSSYCLELTNMLYFMGTKLEKIGLFNDIASSSAKEVYNKAYLENQQKDVTGRNKTTVAECQSVAEESAKYETVVKSIYERCYKLVKYKIDSGYTLVDVLKKIISLRMEEMKLSGVNND